MQRACIICGISLSGRHGGTKTCSIVCRRVHKKSVDHAHYLNNKIKHREYNRLWKLRNPEKAKAISAKATRKHRADPEKRRKMVMATVRWRKKNPEKIKAWQERNRDRILENGRAFRKKHRDKINERERKVHMIARIVRELGLID